MLKIVPVTNKKLLRKFVNFPVKLYKGNPYYVPALYDDELKALDPLRSVHQGADATAQCFLCYRDGKIVGRACGIISHLYNEKNNAHRVRISRFDCINDLEVARATLGAVEDWGRKQGMDIIHGPLGFNDLEREGMLVDGFEMMSTFETNYNYPYYPELIEKLGYVKEVDWLEFQVFTPEKPDERNGRLAEVVSKRLGVHELEIKSISWLVKHYYDKIFDLLDEAYGVLYGTIPITKRVRQSLISQFKMVLNKNLVSVIVDNDDRVVGFGLIFPSIAKGVQKAKGRLFPFGWIPVLRSIHKYENVDFALIGVRQEYQDKGLTSIIFHNVLERFIKLGVKMAETNPQLEENEKVQQLFKIYDPEQVRRRRCYVKSLTGKELTLAKPINKNAKKLKKASTPVKKRHRLTAKHRAKVQRKLNQPVINE